MMNNTVSGIVPFTNLSRGVLYHADISIQFSLQLFRPLINIIQNHIFTSLSKSSGFVLSELRDHHNFYNAATLKHGLYATLLHMLLGYIFIVVGILAILVPPIICYKGLCSKNYINISKYQICFCIEGFLFIIACVFLAFSTTGSIQAAVNIDESIQSYPNLGRAVVDDILTFLDILKVQLDILRHDMCIVLEYKLQCLEELPKKIANATRQLLYPFLPNAETHFKEFYENFQDAVNNSGIISIGNGRASHSLQKAMKEMEMRLHEVKIYLYLLKSKVLRDNGLTIEEKQVLSYNISIIMKHSSIEFWETNVLNWSEINERLNYLSYISLPVANYSASFINVMPQKIENAMAHIVNETEFKRQEIQNWASKNLMDLDNFTDTFMSRNLLYKFKKLMYELDHMFSYLDTSSSEHSGFSGRTLLVLVPGFHSLTVLFIISIASIVGTHEIRRLSQGTREGSLQYKTSYGAKVLHCGVLLGLTLLWLHLLLAGIFYIGSIVLSMFCLPVMDTTIFTEYLDDIRVWNNGTWIDSIMQRYASDYSKGIKMAHVLNNCANNETIYSAFNMTKYWDIKHYMKMDSVRFMKSEILNAVDSGMRKVDLPAEEFMKIIMKDLEYIVQSIDLNFTTQVEQEMLRFSSVNTSTDIIKEILKKIPAEAKYDYIQDGLHIILYEIENIKQITMVHVHRNISLPKRLKEKLDHCREDLVAIIPAFSNIVSLMEQSSHLMTHHLVYSSIETADNFANHFVKHAERSLATDIGKCHVFYALFKKVTWAVCKNGLQLLIGIWLTLCLMGISMTISLILGCRISSYFRGACEMNFRWKQRLHAQNWNQTGVKKSDALLFDDRGEFLGTAVMLSDDAAPRPFSPNALQ